MLITREDSNYLYPASDDAEDKDICDEESADGFLCTRWRRHTGDHAAHTPEGKQVYRWRRE